MSGSTPGDGTDVPGVLQQVSRRAALGLAYAAGLAAFSGCGLRLDLPPPPPPVPTRRPVPDEKLIIALVRELDGLVGHAGAVIAAGRGGKPVTAVRALLAEQAKVLRGRLTNDGVPTSVIDPARPTGTASVTATTPVGAEATGSAAPTTPGSPASPVPTLPALAAALAAVEPADWTGLASATTANRPLALSVQSVRLAASLLLGGAVPVATRPSASRPKLVEHTGPLVYGFEVVAAQSRGAARTRALRALEDAIDLQQALGDSATPAPGGWALPFPVTTPVEANRLAEHLLTTSIAATATLADAANDAPSVEDVARWSGRVQALAARWGKPLTAFPGTAP